MRRPAPDRPLQFECAAADSALSNSPFRSRLWDRSASDPRESLIVEAVHISASRGAWCADRWGMSNRVARTRARRRPRVPQLPSPDMRALT